MWSGPRNISTALMRSWENRPDTFVCDEPLYAHYLRSRPEVDHPGRDEVIARHEADWQRVVAWLTGPLPAGKRVFYQKHMAHHLLPHIGRDWLDQLTHCFLIREPAEMLPSLHKIAPNPGLSDTGLPQQIEILEHVERRTGRTPPVIDARDVLENPRRVLTLLCQRVGLEFREEMLAWPAGPRSTDGVWAKHWYDAVAKSTGFQAYAPKREPLPAALRPLSDACRPYYERLHALRLR
ncbi:MAG: hypothetical protein CHACPFDD_01140 [Phycisphaerae bacterium]|nr:hypothetical protein [Phycisphaerae bacterium]